MSKIKPIIYEDNFEAIFSMYKDKQEVELEMVERTDICCLPYQYEIFYSISPGEPGGFTVYPTNDDPKLGWWKTLEEAKNAIEEDLQAMINCLTENN